MSDNIDYHWEVVGRQVDVEMSSLRLSRSWTASEESRRQAPLSGSNAIHAEGTTPRDAIAPIGLDSIAISTFEVTFGAFQDWKDLSTIQESGIAQLAEEIAHIADAPLAGDRASVRKVCLAALDKFAEVPPTIHLFQVTPIPGVIDRAYWQILAYLPTSVFAQFFDDILIGNATSAALSIELAPLYVRHRHARPLDPQHIGIIKGQSYGWIRSARWGLAPSPPGD